MASFDSSGPAAPLYSTMPAFLPSRAVSLEEEGRLGSRGRRQRAGSGLYGTRSRPTLAGSASLFATWDSNKGASDFNEQFGLAGDGAEGAAREGAPEGVRRVVCCGMTGSQLGVLIGSFAVMFVRYCIATFLSAFFADVCDSMGMTETWNGIIMAAYPTGISVSSIVASFLIFKMGTRTATVVGLVGTSASCLLFGFIPDLTGSWNADGSTIPNVAEKNQVRSGVCVWCVMVVVAVSCWGGVGGVDQVGVCTGSAAPAAVMNVGRWAQARALYAMLTCTLSFDCSSQILE